MPRRTIFDKKNILVIGGAGFIGSHLCDELVKENKVICLDNFSSGEERNIDHLLADPNFEFVRHDITEPLNFESLPELQKFKIEFQGIQEIYNLACPTSPTNFEKNKLNNILANSYGVKNIMDLAVKYESKVMHFSSSVVYGPRRLDNQRISENDLGVVDMLSQRSSYDEGKRFAETIVKNYKDIYGIDAKIIRPFRTYGPRMALDAGNLIPDFINNALRGRDMEIFGDQNFSSSFCYVSDVVDASIKFMASDIFGPLNVGSDIDINITNLAEKIVKILNSKSKIVYKDSLIFLSSLCLPNISRARNELGWMPVITIEKGLEKTVDELRTRAMLVGLNKF